MKKTFKYLIFVLVLGLILSSCTSPAGDTRKGIGRKDVLYLNLTWHQHQPLYYKDDQGVYTRPWVRVHATKDYYDMAAMIKPYPNVRVTINLTPVLMKQLDDFTQNGAKDYYWVLAEKPAAELTDADKTFLLSRFFDANWDNIIYRFPRYKELLNKRGGTSAEAIASAVSQFSEQDFRDLQVWFNLAWIDPEFLAQSPLKELVEKERGFSEADKAVLFNEVRKIMEMVIPVHKELQDSGQIQVITTPYAHPILPLIYNSNIASVGNPAAELPARFSWPNDAIVQLQKSVDIYQQHFGRAPIGLWPGEGAVSEDIIPLVADAGYQWMQTGEVVLAQSLGLGQFTRDSAETVQEADELYRPYYVTTKDGRRVAIFFRDLVLSDKLGFTYSQTPGEQAAADLMQRLENIRLQLKKQKAQGPHIVSIVLDGENAWEYYPNDGKDFLNAMYRMLNESETIKMVTPTEYLELFPKQRELDTLFPGAWFSPNYDTWIGETEETQAWNYLGKTREFLAKYDVGKTKQASPEAIATAQDYMYLAEGSDWFWWYGADQDSGVDEYFDTGFRALLAKVYESLGEPVPAFVRVPIIPRRPEQPVQAFSGMMAVVVDGKTDQKEWATAAAYPANGEDGLEMLYYTMDAQNIYFRLDFDKEREEPESVGIYMSIPSAAANDPFALTEDAPDSLLLGIPASHLFECNAGLVSGYEVFAGKWQLNPELKATAEMGEGLLELAIPLTSLGELSAGDDIRVVIVVQPNSQVLPLSGPAQIVLPDLGLSDLVLEINDPEGDDHGPGTYTYPNDGVFSKQNFDIESFSVATDAKNVIFTFKFYGPVPNPWGSGINLSLQTMDVYIDQDPGKGTGNRMLLPGRNASLTARNGWEYVIWAEGWNYGIYAPDPATGEPKQQNSSYKILVDPARQTVTLRVPKEALGDGNPAEWGYAAVVLSQDGYPSTGVWRVRDVQQTAAQWKLGGAPDDTNHTRIIDLAWPAEGKGTQEEFLSTYISSKAAIETLSEKDMPQIPILLVK